MAAATEVAAVDMADVVAVATAEEIVVAIAATEAVAVDMAEEDTAEGDSEQVPWVVVTACVEVTAAADSGKIMDKTLAADR